MPQPIWLLRADASPADELADAILRCEGFPWLEALPLQLVREIPPQVQLLVVVGQPLPASAIPILARAVAHGTPLIALTPDPLLAHTLGVTPAAPVGDLSVTVTGLAGWEHGALPLLCPDETSFPLSGGLALAQAGDAVGRVHGAALVEARLGQGRAWLFGYDLCQVIATLRHGTGLLDERPARDMGPLYGPRHLYSFFELSTKVPRTIPIADLHQDLLRTLVLQALAGTALPRLWHFPGGSPALWFLKGDGCGEFGADQLVDLAEQHGAYVSFYRPPVSQYNGEQMRAWHARGHGIAIEADVNDLTQTRQIINGVSVRRGRSVDELNRTALPALRARLQAHRDRFEHETGLAMETVCIHSCQWTGAPMARILLDLGWHTPVHFISHDPRMRPGPRYGPYMIASALPLPYYEHGLGVLDLWHMPAQWDESETLGPPEQLTQALPDDWPGYQALPPEFHSFYAAQTPDRVSGFVGLTAAEYGEALVHFAREAAQRWHGIQVANFHPVYVAGPQDHPRASRLALELGLRGAADAGCGFANLEQWSRFFRARAAVSLTDWHIGPDAAEYMTLRAPAGLAQLALLLPETVTQVQLAETGAALPLHTWQLEGRRQTGLIIDLADGQDLSLRVVKRPPTIGVLP